MPKQVARDEDIQTESAAQGVATSSQLNDERAFVLRRPLAERMSGGRSGQLGDFGLEPSVPRTHQVARSDREAAFARGDECSDDLHSVLTVLAVQIVVPSLLDGTPP